MMNYKINEYITLKLEKNGETVIYVGGKKFLHCAFILINITQSEKSGAIIDQIDSIDEAAELLDDVLEENERLDEQPPEIREIIQAIKPETKFWAHSSNLQAWAENEYDTRLLRSNLAFPLLKRLTELGDPIAKRGFKEEIMKRFYSGVESVMGYLIEERYVEDYLDKEDMYNVVQDDVEVLYDIERMCKKYPVVVPKGGEYTYPAVIVENGRIIAINIYTPDIKEIPSSFCSLSKLQELVIAGKNLEIVPDYIDELEQLIKLELHSNRIKELPESIGNLKNLEHLELSNNKLTKLPPSITKLRNLKELILYDNEITKLPEGIGLLASLEKLYLRNNKLKETPEGIGSLTSLKKLYLQRNNVEKLPESIGNLKELEYLGLSNNNLVNIPTTISNLKKLKVLELSRNPINELPDRMDSLESLEHLSLYETNIEKLPESIFLLPKLKIIDIRSTLIKEIPQALQEKSEKITIWLQD